MGTYAPMRVIGGKGGSSFACYGTDGKVLEKIGVWVGGWQVKAIQIWRTGEQGRTWGNPSGGYKEFAFQPGERITKLSLWGNGAGTRLGAIRFETSTGRTFDQGMTEWGRKQEYPVEVGSGICVGIQGRAGSDIDAGGFVFLSPVKNAVLKDVTYPHLTFDTIGIAPQTLDSFQDQNTGQRSRQWKFSGKRAVKTSQSWSVTAGLEVYAEASIEAGIPEVGKAGEKFGWKVSASASYHHSSEESRELAWEVSGTLDPGDLIHLQAVTRAGRLPAIDYRGRMEVTLQSGEVFSYPVAGSYEGVAYTGVEIVDTDTGRALHSAADAAPPTAEPAPSRQVDEVVPV